MKIEALKKDLETLLDYLWDDEARHFKEDRSRDHIFLIMKRLAKEIGFQAPVFTMSFVADSEGGKIVYRRKDGKLRQVRR